MELFNDMRESLDHLETYKILMNLQSFPNEIMCRAFPFTLKRLAQAWFGRLWPGSIDTFLDLSKQFVSHFISGQRCRKPVTQLLNIK